jgi:hypothetical protein
MHEAAVEHTLNIFKHLYDVVSPVVPNDIQAEMKEALEHVENDYTLSLEQLEDTVIIFGKKVWPYRKAFVEYVLLQEGRIGEKLLRAKLSGGLRKKFDAYIEQGGSLRDLHSGKMAQSFSSEERGELCVGLVELNQEIRQQVVQAVHSTKEQQFMDRVFEFSDILGDLEHRLESLRIMADSEQEHPRLAAEIRDHVRAFELGLCALGPEITYDALCAAPEHFEGRRTHLSKRVA